jgi:peptide deformylase
MTFPETIIQIGSPELIAPSLEIPNVTAPEVAELANHLQLLLSPHKLIGISAVQIGIPQRVFVTNVREPKANGKDETTFRVFINPTIIDTSASMVEMFEGCGSILRNNLFGPVSRPNTITIQAFTLEGQKFQLKANGILAGVIQHEFDHLEGILFTEKVSNYKKLMDLGHYIQFAKTNISQKEAYSITLLVEEIH